MVSERPPTSSIGFVWWTLKAAGARWFGYWCVTATVWGAVWLGLSLASAEGSRAFVPPEIGWAGLVVVSALVLVAAVVSVHRERARADADRIADLMAAFERRKRFEQVREWGRNAILDATRILSEPIAGPAKIVGTWASRAEVFLHHAAPGKAGVFRATKSDAGPEAAMSMRDVVTNAPNRRSEIELDRHARAVVRAFAEVVDELRPEDVTDTDPPEYAIFRRSD